MELTEKLVEVRRVSKTVTGGKRLRFRALVVVGNEAGVVGAGIGKAQEVPEAIRKAGYYARRNLIQVPLKGTTIPHEIMAKFGAAKVLLKPAAPGTGVIAAGGIRAVLECAGVKDILTKSLGSSNPINTVQATILALSQLLDPEKELTRRKGLPVKSTEKAPEQRESVKGSQ